MGWLSKLFKKSSSEESSLTNNTAKSMEMARRDINGIHSKKHLDKKNTERTIVTKGRGKIIIRRKPNMKGNSYKGYEFFDEAGMLIEDLIFLAYMFEFFGGEEGWESGEFESMEMEIPDNIQYEGVRVEEDCGCSDSSNNSLARDISSMESNTSSYESENDFSLSSDNDYDEDCDSDDSD